MEPITYSLRDVGSGNSDRYYRGVADFSSAVLAEVQRELGDDLAGFQAFLLETGHEPPRSLPEYALELLFIGVLWRVYGAEEVSRAGLDALLAWLGQSNRFEQASKRLSPWRDYLVMISPRSAISLLEGALTLAAWFEASSLAALGVYTPRVEHFLSEVFPGYHGRDDEVLCGRRLVEYHLCMVGTEILSRAFREAFQVAERKIVVLPPCMKARPDDICQATQTPFGARCAGCTPGCHVSQATLLGEEHGFEVYMLPEDLGVFKGGPGEFPRGMSVGIVGVSCVLTNMEGGWQMKDLGVPAQGLLLDYCGCSYHWHPQGIATDLNREQLLRILSNRF